MTPQQYTDNQIKWIKEYTDAEIRSVRQAVDKVETTNESAVSKLEKTSSDYRATQNEWRGQLKDQSTTFVTRRELWAAAMFVISAAAGIVSIIMWLFK